MMPDKIHLKNGSVIENDGASKEELRGFVNPLPIFDPDYDIFGLAEPEWIDKVLESISGERKKHKIIIISTPKTDAGFFAEAAKR